MSPSSRSTSSGASSRSSAASPASSAPLLATPVDPSPTLTFTPSATTPSASRSIIFTNGTLEARMAAASKEREQTRSTESVVTTQIQQLTTFYPAEMEHQKFDLKHNKFLLQLIGNMPDDELGRSNLAGQVEQLCRRALSTGNTDADRC